MRRSRRGRRGRQNQKTTEINTRWNIMKIGEIDDIYNPMREVLCQREAKDRGDCWKDLKSWRESRSSSRSDSRKRNFITSKETFNEDEDEFIQDEENITWRDFVRSSKRIFLRDAEQDEEDKKWLDFVRSSKRISRRDTEINSPGKQHRPLLFSNIQGDSPAYTYGRHLSESENSLLIKSITFNPSEQFSINHLRLSSDQKTQMEDGKDDGCHSITININVIVPHDDRKKQYQRTSEEMPLSIFGERVEEHLSSDKKGDDSNRNKQNERKQEQEVQASCSFDSDDEPIFDVSQKSHSERDKQYKRTPEEMLHSMFGDSDDELLYNGNPKNDSNRDNKSLEKQEEEREFTIPESSDTHLNNLSERNNKSLEICEEEKQSTIPESSDIHQNSLSERNNKSLEKQEEEKQSTIPESSDTHQNRLSESPELAPSDFYLFGSMKDALSGKHYMDDEEVIDAAPRWLNIDQSSGTMQAYRP
ncbi:repetitive organellar protein-like [Anabrus simplex]|uniref:repetitive organellar protein-like n=1 Tax=Anabrus simplex TaxID=316456 RepID=UPI0035A26574